MDYYDTIITERNAAEAAQILADACRSKDKAIEILINTLRNIANGIFDGLKEGGYS